MNEIKWRVSEAPTGNYRSFAKRDWPAADYNDSQLTPAAMITCNDSYCPADVKAGKHAPLKVWIADHSLAVKNDPEVGSWKWRTLKGEFATLAEAKAAAANVLKKNPILVPTDLVYPKNLKYKPADHPGGDLGAISDAIRGVKNAS
jgi:hypothetical protein